MTLVTLRRRSISRWIMTDYCFFPKVLAEIPESKAALENVNVFKKAWVDQVKKFRPF